jgi:predicted permease
MTTRAWVEMVGRDFGYALRTLRRSRGFAVVAALTLALGIGANTAIFTLLDQVLLRLLPVKNPQELVLLTERGHHYGSNWGGNAISYPMYRDFQDHNEVFSGMFCRFPDHVSLTFNGQSERVAAELVSGTYFPVLGIGAVVGRAFTPDDDRVRDGHPLVMLSYAYWKQRFAGDPQIVGKAVLVNNFQMTIVGVAQPGFDGVEWGYATKIFVPMMMQKEIVIGSEKMLTDRRTRWVNAFGRLMPGVSVTKAKASLQPFMHSMLELEVKESAFRNASAYDREQFLKSWIDLYPGSQGRAQLRRDMSTPLWVLMATTGMVLLIACANIANLLLARATGRQKEIAVRLAMGATRGRIVSQLLIETLSLSALGGILGLALAFWADKALMAIYLPSDANGLNISTAPDFRILLFTLGVTVVTGIVFGLAPALQATRPDVGSTLKDQAGAVVGGAGRGRLRNALVVTQVAMSLLLLIGAGLFLRSLRNLSNLGPGFQAERLVGFNIDPSLNGYSVPRLKTFYQQLTSDLRALPGVQSVAVASMRIMENNEWDSSMTAEGYTAPKPEDRADPFMNMIGPGYFATLGIPIVAGRDFRITDDREVKRENATDAPENERWMPGTVIINEKFARKYFAGRNPIGMHVGFGSDPGTPTPMEVIGVVKDVKYTNLRDEIPVQAFVPYMGSRYLSDMTVYLRTVGEPNQLMTSIRAKVRETDANLPIYAMRTMDEQISNSLSTERMVASLSTVFGFVATVLAIIGLYGVMSYSVSQRTREIGIRMALGAEQGKVVGMVMREVLILIVIGVGVGVPAALALTKLVKSQLYGLEARDPWTLGVATALLVFVACAAGYIPALRASRVDPMKALRYE